MPTPVEARRALFAAVLSSYHNDLSCDGLSEARHSVEYIQRAARAGCVEAVTQVDPRMTSTSFGAAAVQVARKVMENAKAAKSFIDVEMCGANTPAICVSFDRVVDRAVAYGLLAGLGESAIVCKPDDKIAPGMVSDIHLYFVEPSEAVVQEALSQVREANQALLAEMQGCEYGKPAKKPVPPSAKRVGKGTAPGTATADAQTSEAVGMSEAVLALHQYVYGDQALAHLDESSRSASALMHMMRVFGPGGSSQAVRETDPFNKVVAKARCLHESQPGLTDYSALVDEIAVEIHPGDTINLADAFVLSPEDDVDAVKKVVTENVHARSEYLQMAARAILLGEGILPPHLHKSLESFVGYIKAVTPRRTCK